MAGIVKSHRKSVGIFNVIILKCQTNILLFTDVVDWLSAYSNVARLYEISI